MNTPESSIVRVFNAHGDAVGSGFLISTKLIVTCAHVVQSALGTDESNKILRMDLPLIAAGKVFSGRVVFQDEEKDISCMEISLGLPRDAEPVPMVSASALWGHSFRAFGFPRGHENGVWASGVLRGNTGAGWLQIEDVKGTGFGIQPGFSGGPVWDDQLQAVVGMVVAAETDISVKAAFCIPVNVLAEAYPPLHDYVIQKGVEPEGRRVPTKRRLISPRMIAGVLGLIVALYSPWVYNNYYYRVPRPDMATTFCQASLEPIQVGVAELPNCSAEFRASLMENWKSETVDVMFIPQSFESWEDARSQAGDSDAVVWGACNEPDQDIASLNFGFLTSRKPYEIYEPAVLRAIGSDIEITDIGLALFSYQYGDYPGAARSFAALSATAKSKDLMLLNANSLLLDGQYITAIASYKEITQTQASDSAAAYNNLGVALANDDRNQALGWFNQAIDLADNLREVDIESLARVNRSQLFQLDGKWDEAQNDCETAILLNAKSALPYVCLAKHNFIYFRFRTPWLLPLNEINKNLNEAEKYADAPALLHFMRADWHLSHSWKQKQEAVNAYARYLSEMENRACLKIDQVRIADAIGFVDELTYIPKQSNTR